MGIRPRSLNHLAEPECLNSALVVERSSAVWLRRRLVPVLTATVAALELSAPGLAQGLDRSRFPLCGSTVRKPVCLRCLPGFLNTSDKPDRSVWEALAALVEEIGAAEEPAAVAEHTGAVEEPAAVAEHTGAAAEQAGAAEHIGADEEPAAIAAVPDSVLPQSVRSTQALKMAQVQVQASELELVKGRLLRPVQQYGSTFRKLVCPQCSPGFQNISDKQLERSYFLCQRHC